MLKALSPPPVPPSSAAQVVPATVASQHRPRGHRPLAALRQLLIGAVAALTAVTALASDPRAAYAADRGAMPLPTPVTEDRLTITVEKAGGADGTYELECHPDGGNHPDVQGACDRLGRSTTWGSSPFSPVAPGTMCTMQYGGPATARITGTWAGRAVDARFDRRDGCEIARWDALVPVLPPFHG
ncbi:SSI family serine proteinase inhibitor [Streptomyces sp. CRN 30]|uniref:SSI family serine proteinase inhibitor n=1 Tax=Streptomyces sp. CRN 30 TaxID=3075613 RepID=UPI002A8119A4|nr:SSI family serine proteinase inhibitor [Streptomyces sp. CRN 30]